MSEHQLTDRQQTILEFIEAKMRERGFPPSVREIGSHVGLASPSSVHSHLATLQDHGYLQRDPDNPRNLKVMWDPMSGAVEVERRHFRHVPLVGQVAAGTDVLAQEQVEEMLPVPVDFTGDGELFMLTVRGDSMIEAGILNGDYVVARVQETASDGDVVVAGIPGDEATVKTYHKKRNKIILEPANSALEPMEFDPGEVSIYGRVVTVMRRL
jgi:repressor LexA